MPGARLPMRNIRDVLRLTAAGMSSRKIAASLSIGATTVIDCLHRARRAGLTWPLSDGLDNAMLELRLYPPQATAAFQRSRTAIPNDCGQAFQLIADSIPTIADRSSRRRLHGFT